jgi:hypothetical protein
MASYDVAWKLWPAVSIGDAVSIKEVADMVDPRNQVHVPERPNDMIGSLANTCVAKSLLGRAWQNCSQCPPTNSESSIFLQLFE